MVSIDTLDTLPDFQAAELSLVDQYRKQKNTAVLTILFTDIKGFTEIAEKHGETFSNEFRRAHDAILHPIIERDNGGRVIKTIGDSVMAIFSEPSTAVARSLEIQKAIREANRNIPPGQPELSVRIGLHTGQVTTEDRVSLDVFGRHVNRAARVQGLADGGQILMTYPVFDSAKGWLMGTGVQQNTISWQEHGRYKLKGIPEEIEIYEAYNPDHVNPRKPRGGLASRSKSRLIPLFAIGALAAVVVGLLAYQFGGHTASTPTPAVVPGTPIVAGAAAGTTVSLIDFSFDDDSKIDNQAMVVDGQKTDHIRKLISPTLAPGRHLLYNDISCIVRNFKSFDVKQGATFVPDEGYNRVELPAISRHLDYDAAGPTSLDESAEEDFATYPADAAAWPKNVHGKIDLKITRTPTTANPKQFDFKFEWTISEDGRVINQDHTDIITDLTSEKTEGPRVLLKNSDYFYVAKFTVNNGSATGDIEANFIDYLDRTGK